MNTETRTSHYLKNLSAQDFLNLGQSHIAYVRQAQLDGKTVYAVHEANGKNLFVHESLPMAVTIARQRDLEPVTVQ